MRLVANLLILMALFCAVVGIASRFLNIIIIFPDIRPLSFITVANTFLLLALVMKLANE